MAPLVNHTGPGNLTIRMEGGTINVGTTDTALRELTAALVELVNELKTKNVQTEETVELEKKYVLPPEEMSPAERMEYFGRDVEGLEEKDEIEEVEEVEVSQEDIVDYPDEQEMAELEAEDKRLQELRKKTKKGDKQAHYDITEERMKIKIKQKGKTVEPEVEDDLELDEQYVQISLQDSS